MERTTSLAEPADLGLATTIESPLGGLPSQFARFLGAGGLAVACQWALLIGLVELDLLGPVAASATGFAFATSLSYLLRRRFVFRSRLAHRHCLPRYAAVATIALGLTTALMALGVKLLLLPYLAVQLVTSATVTTWNFVGHRRWTFRRHPRAR